MNFKKLERAVRGFSNHRRIQIMELLRRRPELSVEEIASELKINYKTAADHIRRLAIASLLIKRNEANAVRHKLTAQAHSTLKFLRTLE
jgi:predicted transcriptional regulator